MDKQTDNHDPAPKLELRRHFLRKYHDDTPPRVLDCCQGSGKLWDVLLGEFKVARYWGVDLKPRPGRLKIDSTRILAQAGWQLDVIDVDTYGAPWSHWGALLPNVTAPVTVFLTLGTLNGTTLTNETLGNLGITFADRMPYGLRKAEPLKELVLRNELFRMPMSVGINIIEAVEAESSGSARYFGVRLEPATGLIPSP